MTRDVEDGDFVFGAEWSTIFRMLNDGWGIKDGYEVLPSSGLQVNVASGSHLYPSAGVLTNYGHAAQSETHDSESTLPDYRYDLIVIDSAGTSHIVKGTVNQKAPAIPANRMVLAVVRIANGATVIGTGDIYDARPLMYWRPGRYVDTTNSLYVLSTWGQPARIKLNAGEGLQHKAGTPTQLGLHVVTTKIVTIPAGSNVDDPTGIIDTPFIVAWAVDKDHASGGPSVYYRKWRNTSGNQQEVVRWYNTSGVSIDVDVKYIKVGA